MKRTLASVVFLVSILSAVAAFADPVIRQIPLSRETTLGAPADYTFRFSLWDLQSGGSVTPDRIWWEEKGISLADPTINTFLGSVTDPAQRSGDLGDVDFSQQYWVQVEKREADGAYTVVGARTMFTMAPYAIWAAQGGNVTSVTAGNGLTGTGTKGDIALSVNPGAGLATASDGSLKIASGGVNNSMIVDTAVTKNKIGGLNYGGITFGNSSGNLEQNPSNLFWDVINNRLGLGTSVPQDQLHITGNLRLPSTSGTSGQIKLAGIPFIHAYGSGNAFVGSNAGNLTMTGANNTAVGNGAMKLNTAGYSNTAIGAGSLYGNTDGYYNAAVGNNTLVFNTSGAYNTAVGSYALYANTTGNYNTANGISALRANTTGSENTASGAMALSSNSTGEDNTASGYGALYSNTTGSRNTADGLNALYLNTTGSYNTALGQGAGMSNTIGSYNTFLGAWAGLGANNLTNATAIGSNSLVGLSNSLVLGSAGVNVGIGTSYPTITLDVQGTNWLIGHFKNRAGTGDRTAMVRFETGDTTPTMWNLGTGGAGNGIGQTSGQFYLESASSGVAMSVEKNKNIHFYPSGGGSCNLSNGASGWSCSSDRNLKENFTELDRQQILDNLSAMPVTMWNMKGTTVKHIGPVAQDFHAAFNVGEDDTHINTVDANGVSMAAIQALYDLVKKQLGMIEKQQREIDGLKALLGAAGVAGGR